MKASLTLVLILNGLNQASRHYVLFLSDTHWLDKLRTASCCIGLVFLAYNIKCFCTIMEPAKKRWKIGGL